MCDMLFFVLQRIHTRIPQKDKNLFQKEKFELPKS